MAMETGPGLDVLIYYWDDRDGAALRGRPGQGGSTMDHMAMAGDI